MLYLQVDYLMYVEYEHSIFFYFLSPERNELQKDIEQLCMQQGGPSILGVATRMHFQRYLMV